MIPVISRDGKFQRMCKMAMLSTPFLVIVFSFMPTKMNPVPSCLLLVWMFAWIRSIVRGDARLKFEGWLLLLALGLAGASFVVNEPRSWVNFMMFCLLYLVPWSGCFFLRRAKGLPLDRIVVYALMVILPVQAIAICAQLLVDSSNPDSIRGTCFSSHHLAILLTCFFMMVAARRDFLNGIVRNGVLVFTMVVSGLASFRALYILGVLVTIIVAIFFAALSACGRRCSREVWAFGLAMMVYFIVAGWIASTYEPYLGSIVETGPLDDPMLKRDLMMEGDPDCTSAERGVLGHDGSQSVDFGLLGADFGDVKRIKVEVAEMEEIEVNRIYAFGLDLYETGDLDASDIGKLKKRKMLVNRDVKVAAFAELVLNLKDKAPHALYLGLGPGNVNSRAANWRSREWRGISKISWVGGYRNRHIDYFVLRWENAVNRKDQNSRSSLLEEPFGTWQSLLAEMGMVGVLVWMVMIGAFMVDVISRSEVFMAGECASIALVLIYSGIAFFLDVFSFPDLIGIFWIAQAWFALPERGPDRVQGPSQISERSRE